MKNYNKPNLDVLFVHLEDVILNSGIENNSTLETFDPDETWTIFDGGKE